MPTKKDGDSAQTNPEESAGPSRTTPDASTSSDQPADKPSSSSSSSISSSLFYGLNSPRNDENERPGNPKKRRIQRVERIDHDNVLGFDDSSSSDSNVTLESETREDHVRYYNGVEEEEEVDLEEEEEEDEWIGDDDEDDMLDMLDGEDEDEDDRNNGLLQDLLMFGGSDRFSPEMNNRFEFSDADDDSDPFDISMELFSDMADEDSSDEDSDLPEDPFEREILGSAMEPDTSLHLAAMKGDLKSLGRWQAWGTGIWARKVKGDSDLHCAARSGDVATVEHLIKMGEPLNITNKKRHTPLEVAALCGHATVVKTLLDHGAGNDTEQMEHALLATKSAAVVDTLVDANNSLLIGITGVDVLSRAARDGRVLMIRALLKGGADANWPGTFSRTALHTAASRGHVRCLVALLENSADVSCVDDRLWTALHYAAYHSHRECVRVLLAAGADPNALSGEGQVPYDVAFDEEIHRQLENA